MTDDPFHALVVRHLGRIAPEVPLDDIDPKADLREEFDIDSMDFMTLISGIGKELFLPMPDTDYDQMRRFDDLVAYVRSQVG